MLWLIEDNRVVCGPLTTHEDRGGGPLVVLRGEGSGTEHHHSTMRIRVLDEGASVVVDVVEIGTVRLVVVDSLLEQRAGAAPKADRRRSRRGGRGRSWSRSRSSRWRDM